MIQYISTRGQAPALNFEDVALTGLASDGGLYVPDTIPSFSPQELIALASLPYTELAFRIMQPFIGDAISAQDLRKLIEDAYKTFRHSAVAPLVQLNHSEFMLELFHGPTLAFKDFALQFLGRVMEHFLTRRKEKVTIIGATSGDTGSAAIEGCRGRKNMRLFILYPQGRVSDVQRRQMTTVQEKNVFCLAVKGSFDDCQNLVKTLFADEDFRRTQKLAAVNSINWVRILAQTVYYFYAALSLGAPARKISFSVPTGNFGDIYAGYIAKRMGLPIEKLIIATNSNDILSRCLATGTYDKGKVIPTLSPSMDIQISSNFERLLFDLYARNADAVCTLMHSSNFSLSSSAHHQLQNIFAARKADNKDILATIKSLYKKTGELIDPHTAVGIHAGRHCHKGHSSTLITLATAHPAKFPNAVKKATGIYPPLPAHLAPIMTRRETFSKMGNDVSKIRQFIESKN